jgi:hypothetical protein
MPDWYRCRVFDIKALLIDEIDNTIKPIEDKVENNEVILTDDRHQEITISDTDTLNLVLPTGKEYEEIHLHIDVLSLAPMSVASLNEGVMLTFSEPCRLYGVDELKYGERYELELIKTHGEWICRNPNLQIGNIVHTAVIRQINYLEDEEFKKEFECINMTFEEAKSIVMSRGVLTILLQLSSGATLPTTYYVDYEFEVSYNEFIITAWKYENGSREVIYWRDNGLVMS